MERLDVVGRRVSFGSLLTGGGRCRLAFGSLFGTCGRAQKKRIAYVQHLLDAAEGTEPFLNIVPGFGKVLGRIDDQVEGEDEGQEGVRVQRAAEDLAGAVPEQDRHGTDAEKFGEGAGEVPPPEQADEAAPVAVVEPAELPGLVVLRPERLDDAQPAQALLGAAHDGGQPLLYGRRGPLEPLADAADHDAGEGH